MATLHGSLDPADISGFRGSQVCLVRGAVWVSSPVIYEDWYLVDDFTTLGALNEAAVAADGSMTTSRGAPAKGVDAGHSLARHAGQSASALAVVLGHFGASPA